MSTQQSSPPEWLSLGDDEEILWQDTPTLTTEASTFVWAGLLTVTVILAPIGLLMAASSYLAVQNREYVMTTQKFYQKSGVLSTATEESAVGNMQNMSYSQSFFGSMFDFGTIEIADASDSVTFRNVNDPKEVKQELTELANTHRTQTRQSQASDTDELRHSSTGNRETIEELTETVAAVNKELEQFHAHIESDSDSDSDRESASATNQEMTDTTETVSKDGLDDNWDFHHE